MMQELDDLRDIAKQLRNNADYEGMVKTFGEMWNQHQAQINAFDCWGYALALNKMKKYKQAIEICRTGYEINANNDYLNTQYAWAGYMHYLNNYNNSDIQPAEKHAQGILTILENVSDNSFTLNKTVLKMMKLYAANNEWDNVLEWVGKVSAGLLSTEQIEIKGKKVPSEKLSYYYKYTKALEKKENYTDCLAVCKDALSEFPHDFWLRWRKAICLMQSDQTDDSISIFEELLLEKNDWFLLRGAAEAYYNTEDFDKAFEYAIKACIEASKSPSIGMTADAFLTAGEILHKLENYDIAKKHVELTYLIRIEEGWNKIPQKLELAAKKVDIVLNEVEGESSKHLNELKKYWKEKQNEFIKNLPVQMGKIKTILPNGMAGFIKNNDGTDYYFAKRDFSGNPNDIKEGLSVKFNIKESFDKKKKKKSVAAFNIILDN